jgi:hypothetical protein
MEPWSHIHWGQAGRGTLRLGVGDRVNMRIEEEPNPETKSRDAIPCEQSGNANC